MKDFFPQRPEARPTIYAYRESRPEWVGLLKVGYTLKTAAERVGEQT